MKSCQRGVVGVNERRYTLEGGEGSSFRLFQRHVDHVEVLVGGSVIELFLDLAVARDDERSADGQPVCPGAVGNRPGVAHAYDRDAVRLRDATLEDVFLELTGRGLLE